MTDEAVAELRALGVPAADIEAAAAAGRLPVLLLQHRLLPGVGRYTTDEVRAIAGDDWELNQQLWRAMGFPEAEGDAALFSDLDVQLATSALADLAKVGLDGAMVVQQTRVIASAMATIAEAIIDVVTTELTTVPADGDAYQDELCARVQLMDLGIVEPILDYVLRRQIVDALERRLAGERPDAGSDHQILTVGFADLAGFTRLSRKLDAPQLARLVRRFDGTVRDVVAEGGGKVVKTIGDAVLFTALDVGAAADMALDVVAHLEHEADVPPVRVGLDTGPVIVMGGDCFGPTVNRASRISGEARAGAVVVSPSVHDGLVDRAGLVMKSIGNHHLKGIGPTALWVLRRA
ncbi:MAG: adenylate/guanylate cyclase domain-containing protein [Acidimicrobiales bacterium]